MADTGPVLGGTAFPVSALAFAAPSSCAVAMNKISKPFVMAGTLGLLLVLPAATANAASLPDPATDQASCMGSGSSFYGTFAPQQRAFVAQFVIDQADATGSAPGTTYSWFAQEKEGGAIPAPCGTRIE